MQEAINIIRRIDDYCPICNKNYALELYDRYGNKLNYYKLLNQNNLNKLNSLSNTIMKCRYCNNEIMIDRTDQNRYIPLIANAIKDNSYNIFFEQIEERKQKLYKKHKIIERGLVDKL